MNNVKRKIDEDDEKSWGQGLTQQEADDQSYFENLQDCLNHERGAAA